MRTSDAFFCALLACGSACADPQPEIGVAVFSNDTVPARFAVTLSGTLVVGLRGTNFFMRPDKSLVLETPGTLIVQEGSGTATISTLDSTQRVAVLPLGTPPESADSAGLVGTSIQMSRTDGERRVNLAVIKP